MATNTKPLWMLLEEERRDLSGQEKAERKLVSDLWCAIHGEDSERCGLAMSEEEWSKAAANVKAVLLGANETILEFRP